MAEATPSVYSRLRQMFQTHLLENTSTRIPREELVVKNAEASKVVQRAHDVQKDESEARDEARGASPWPRANAHLECRRDRAQILESVTRDLGKIQKKAIR